MNDKRKWAKGGKPRGPRLAKFGLQRGKYCCNRRLVAHSWKFCPNCGRELFGLDLPSTRAKYDGQSML